jgi:hypothetical protein
MRQRGDPDSLDTVERVLFEEDHQLQLTHAHWGRLRPRLVATQQVFWVRGSSTSRETLIAQCESRGLAVDADSDRLVVGELRGASELAAARSYRSVELALKALLESDVT